jgi:hypothetical protein
MDKIFLLSGNWIHTPSAGTRETLEMGSARTGGQVGESFDHYRNFLEPPTTGKTVYTELSEIVKGRVIEAGLTIEKVQPFTQPGCAKGTLPSA